MKENFTLMIFLVVLQISVFAQTKINEYERTSSDLESAYMDDFLTVLYKQKDSKGLIVIYVNSKNRSFGNLSAYVKGIEKFLELRKAIMPEQWSTKYSIQVKVGKPRTELWMYPKDVKLPESDLLEFRINDEKLPFHYGQTCVDCSPAVPLLSWNYMNFEHYSKFIKTNENYKALITISQNNYDRWTKKESYQDAINNVIAYRKLLVEDYGIPKNKVKIIIKKPIAEKNSPVIADFYITKHQVK
ncbi:MAG: hypothetical protein M3405_00755 [Acidobacteriota bacterium]|jgi:hypothetical protein|nr:hypothetical protein [Acidobacteriota bacterium]